MCKRADEIQKRTRHLESVCMTNEVDIEELEKLHFDAKTMFADSEKKLDENTRRLGIMENELKVTITVDSFSNILKTRCKIRGNMSYKEEDILNMVSQMNANLSHAGKIVGKKRQFYSYRRILTH